MLPLLSGVRRASNSWTLLLFTLATITLVGSVVIPGAESARVLGLLDDEARLLEPARLVSGRLESGIAEEAAELQRYLLSGDPHALARFRAATTRDERDLRQLRALASELDGTLAMDAATLDRLVERWWSLTARAVGARPSGQAYARGAAAREATRDSIVVVVASAQSKLAAWSEDRRVALAEHERRGLMTNAALVIVALTALAAVFEVTRRERERMRREAALRVAAESLARPLDLETLTERIAACAGEMLGGSAACVGRLEATPDGLRIVVASTTPAAALAPWAPAARYEGSLAERAIRQGEPIIVAPAGDSAPRARGPRVLMVPLGTEASPIGVVVLREPDGRRFRADDRSWAAIFGQLASLAYEKVRLLEEARESRAQLQRTMDSRSALMRGFSHDVKNPLGAADGYASLLQDGIYGPISDEQRFSIGRVRQGIQRALSLVDDLHELARAQTGRLALRAAPTDVAEIVRAVGDEYRAAASAHGLEFVIEVAPGLPPVDTDASRVQQILGNLLSNAIKYTDAGRVMLRAHAADPCDDTDAASVLVDVQDSGPGIPLAQQELIFEEFARLPGNTHLGAGLGLAISRHVADALGCQLTVTSEVGNGSVFVLQIPTRWRSRGAPVAESSPTPLPPLPSPPARDGRPAIPVRG